MKMAHSTFKIICFSLVALASFCFSFWSAKTFSFEDLFQGVDFEQLARDIEKAVADEEAKNEDRAGRPILPKTGVEQPAFPTTPQSSQQFPEPVKKAGANLQDEGTDLKKLFLEPIIATQEKGKQALIKISDQKQKAYNHYMDQLVELLASIEQIIETSPEYSDQFKLFFTHYQDALDEITVQKDIFASKKLYLAVLYSDNPATNELRKSIIDTVNELSKIYKQIKISEADEIRLAEQEQAELLKRAHKKLDLPEPRKVIERKKPGRRGAPTPKPLKPSKIDFDADNDDDDDTQEEAT